MTDAVQFVAVGLTIILGLAFIASQLLLTAVRRDQRRQQAAQVATVASASLDELITHVALLQKLLAREQTAHLRAVERMMSVIEKLREKEEQATR